MSGLVQTVPRGCILFEILEVVDEEEDSVPYCRIFP